MGALGSRGDGRGVMEGGAAFEAIKISVRNLVEFVLRSGDLDNRQTGLPGSLS